MCSVVGMCFILVLLLVMLFFFFKQKTAYEFRSSDWSSDVCSSDLTATALGPLGVLVNNASLFEYDHVETASEDSWDRHLDTNLKAPFFLSQAFAAQLPADVPGNIVNIVDMRVWRLTPHFASYTVAKAGLWTLTQTLAMALAPHILVNAIGPGPVLPSPRQSPVQLQRPWQGTPLTSRAHHEEDRNRVMQGQSGSVLVYTWGRRSIYKKK